MTVFSVQLVAAIMHGGHIGDGHGDHVDDGHSDHDHHSLLPAQCPLHSWCASNYLLHWPNNVHRMVVEVVDNQAQNVDTDVYCGVQGPELKSDSPPSQMLILSRYCYQSRKQWCSRD